MDHQFDELAKAMAQSLTRRTALRRLSVALVGAALAALGAKSAPAAPRVALNYRCCVYKGYSGNLIPTPVMRYLCVPADQDCPQREGGILISDTLVKNCQQCKK